MGAQGVKVTKNFCMFHLRKSQKTKQKQKKLKATEISLGYSDYIQQKQTKQYTFLSSK